LNLADPADLEDLADLIPRSPGSRSCRYRLPP
jgi:hypothetical protein